MDMRSLPTEFVLEFIDLYKSFPCLWKIKSKEYFDHDKKNFAYEQLVNKLKEKIPGATRRSVIMKLDSFRGSFRKEYKKVTDSIKSGADAEEIYTPRLRYFKHLLFLKDHILPGRSKTTIPENSATEQGPSIIPTSHQCRLTSSSNSNNLNFQKTKRGNILEDIKMDRQSLPKQFVLEFIELYKSFPCLWKIKSQDYSDRDKKNFAYEQLVNKLKEKIPGANKKSVIRKVDSLRSSFRKELKKIADAEEIYAPRLWFFEHLLFLKDHELPRRSITTIPENSTTEQEDSLSQEELLVPSSPDNFPDLTQQTGTPESDISSRSTTGGLKKAKLYDVVLRKINKELDVDNREDEVDIFVKHLSTKLRKLPKEVETVTEKLILDLVFHAELGYIDRYTSVQITSGQSTIASITNHNAPIRTKSNQHVQQAPRFFIESVSTINPGDFELIENLPSTSDYEQNGITNEDQSK